jgi:LemA protein
MTHEENMIDSITDARSKLTTSINSVNDAKEKLSDAIDSNNLDSEIEASEEVSIAIDKLTTVVMEAYPDFSSDTEYQSVMDSIEGAAHRVQVARVDYAASIATYNNEVRKFPNNVIAKLFNFEKKEYLKADDAANNSSMVDLD